TRSLDWSRHRDLCSRLLLVSLSARGAAGSGSRTPEGSRGTERVLEKLDVVNLSVSQLREEREGRRDFLAGLAPAIRERAEHRDLVVLSHDLADPNGPWLPRP